jgi:hypothetical protein
MLVDRSGLVAVQVQVQVLVPPSPISHQQSGCWLWSVSCYAHCVKTVAASALLTVTAL